ncbi:unnamed protein product, partial [Rotaria sordida]
MSKKIEWKSIEHYATFIDDQQIDKDLLYNDFNHIKPKYIELKERFGDIHKQIQKFISSNLVVLKQVQITTNDETNLCNEFDLLDRSDTNEKDPCVYLEEYYSEIQNEDKHHLYCLAKAYANVTDGSTLLEFGGGPTLYQLMSAAAK